MAAQRQGHTLMIAYPCKSVQNLTASAPCRTFWPLLPYERWCESCKAQQRKDITEARASRLISQKDVR
jgi:uncharacterized protein (DUF2237 family)